MKKLSAAQQKIVDILTSDKNLKITRDEFLYRSYYIALHDGNFEKIREKTVHYLHRVGILKMSERDNMKYYYTLK